MTGAQQSKTLAGTNFPGYELVPDEAKAGLIIVHGIAEHGWRYRHVAEALARNGIACFIYDQRGHGESLGSRTHVADFADFAHDAEAVGAAIRARFPKLPLFVWGHSMGSVVVALAAIEGMGWTRGIITTGCALDAMPKLDGMTRIMLRIATTLAPRLRISLGLDPTALTHDVQIQRQHMSDPLVPRSASLQLLYGFAQACTKCHANLPKITRPWLAAHGEADTVCPISGSTALIRGLGSSDKQLVSYAGLRHELHNEDLGSRAELFDLMTRWMLERSRRHGGRFS